VNRFARQRTEGGVDLTVDASLYGAYAFGAFAVHHPMVRSTMVAVQQQLWVPAPLGGCIRYPGDTYQCASVEPQGLGNPWIICTLWLAQYEIEAATTGAELEQAYRYLDWVTAHAQPSGELRVVLVAWNWRRVCTKTRCARKIATSCSSLLGYPCGIWG
jgi:GH15 family glucan-1,4-alpha-glucosidase